MKKILVLIRETFPTNEILTEENLKEKRVLNPYDEYSLFQAKKIREKTVGGEISVLFLSNRKSQYGLRTALGLGADKGIFIYCSENTEERTAEVLAKEIRKEEYDAVFTGIRDVNDDREELPYKIAAILDIPIYPHLLSVDYDISNCHFIGKQERDNTIDKIEISNKGIFAFSQNVYEPEYPSINSIMSIKDKPIREAEYILKPSKVKPKIAYQNINRKQEIYKKITGEKGTEKLLEYLKQWKLID